jgi:NtrC-family two-component system sensor histidine kinase KinB
MRIGLLAKFVLVMGALALTPAIYMAAHLSKVSQGGIQASVLELHTELAGNLADQIESYLKVNDEKILFAANSLRQDLTLEQKQLVLSSLIDTHPDVLVISALNQRGLEVIKAYNQNPDVMKAFPILSTETALSNRSGEEGFVEAFTGQHNTRVVTKVGDDVILLAYYPLNETVVLRVAVSLRSFSDWINSKQAGGTGFAVIVDGKGQPLFYPRDTVAPETIAEIPKWPIVASALQSKSLGSSEFADSKGREFVGAYSPVSSMGWAAIFLQPRDEAYAASIEMRRTSKIILMVVVGITILASFLMARLLTSPLLSLTRAAESVAKGAFDVAVKISTRDELQDLAETFNKMAAQLRAYAALQVDRLVAEQRKTKAILYTIDEGILLSDQQAHLQLANRRALDMLAIDPNVPFEGKPLAEVAPKSDLTAATEKSAADPKPDKSADVAVGPEKSRVYFRVRSLPVKLPDSTESAGVVTALRDITFEKELDKMKDDFLHHITHDLRNPLGSVIGFVEVLLKGGAGELTAQQRTIIGSMQRSLSRQMSMINNILDIAKMDSGRTQLQLKVVSPAEFAARSMGMLESLYVQKKLNVSLAIPAELKITGDSDLLERVITNLLGNAIKYTPSGGSIVISTEEIEGGKVVRFCVADTGPGIPEAYLTRVFEKFEQVTGQRSGGTGLGLTITKHFVEAHLGKIWVESQLGKGSRFLFTIPQGLKIDEKGAVVITPGTQGPPAQPVAQPAQPAAQPAAAAPPPAQPPQPRAQPQTPPPPRPPSA